MPVEGGLEREGCLFIRLMTISCLSGPAFLKSLYQEVKDFGVGPQKMQFFKIPHHSLSSCPYTGPPPTALLHPRQVHFSHAWKEGRPGSLGHLRAHIKWYCSGKERLAEA